MDDSKIFIIDDDPIFRLIVRKIIEKSGKFSQLEFYENGYDGWVALQNAIAAHQPPGTILLDIEMPKMDGWQFMESFETLPQEQVAGIAIYIVTSSIAQEDRDKAASHTSIKRYLTKPITVDTINDIAS